MLAIQKLLRQQADPDSAAAMMRYFKTGPGQYAEGDRFLGGMTTADLKQLASQHITLSNKDLKLLFKSPYHEERYVAAYIVVLKYQKSKTVEDKAKMVRFYLQNKEGLNNWDLVDMSAYKVLDDFCVLTKDTKPLLDLSRSKRHWDRRMAMVATFALIRHQDLDLTYALAKQFFNDPQDLMHKATGWMLREAGKRDQKRLEKFVLEYGRHMPRVMLRYAIEKFPALTRQRLLKLTRN